jgi:hypothetical protein
MKSAPALAQNLAIFKVLTWHILHATLFIIKNY